MRPWTFLASLVYLSGTALAIAASIVTWKPIGADYYFHLQISREWWGGIFAMFGPTAMRVNQFPYFSILHFLLIPSLIFQIEYETARWFQVFFVSASLGLTMLLAQRRGGDKAAALTGMLLLGCFAFFDAAIQVRPQSLALVLLPLTLGFYMSNQQGGFLASFIAMVYTHGVAALSMVYSLVAAKFLSPGWKRTVTLAFVASVPIVAISVWFAGGAWSKWSGVDASAQERFFWEAPQVFIPIYSGALLVAYPVLGYAAVTWKKQSQYVKMLVMTVLGSLPMLALWPDRWLQYTSIPLALLGGEWLSEPHGEAGRAIIAVLLPVIAILFVVYQINYWWVTLTSGWYVPSQSPWLLF